jgi:hypothetical protein
MPALHRWVVATFALAVAATSLPVSAQIIEIRESNGKQIFCAQSGLRGFAMPCGIDKSYDYIFIGSVLYAAQISEREKNLLLAPEEIFHGNPPSELTVTTAQGDCLPDIQPGDHWLFYLRRDNETHKFLLWYASGSGPVAQEQKTIALLRRLTAIPDSGIIRGDVQRLVLDDTGKAVTNSSVPKHKLVAKRAADGVEYTTFTDEDGNYEFELLPAGDYKLTANTEKTLWAEEGSIDVHAHGCRQVQFELYPDGTISGRLRSAQGKAAANKWVQVTPASAPGSEFKSAITDERGYFEIRGLKPARYLLGININSDEGSPEWRSRLYYPGVRNKDLAVTIDLGLAEKRTNLVLQLPAK